MDSRWDLGFITDEQEYIQQRLQLQQELERLTPVDNDDLERAVDLLDNFTAHWNVCAADVEEQASLVRQIVERVYVQGKEVVAMTLRSNCHLVLGHKINGPTAYTVDPFILDESTPVSFGGTNADSCGLDGCQRIRCPFRTILVGILVEIVVRHSSRSAKSSQKSIYGFVLG